MSPLPWKADCSRVNFISDTASIKVALWGETGIWIWHQHPALLAGLLVLIACATRGVVVRRWQSRLAFKAPALPAPPPLFSSSSSSSYCFVEACEEDVPRKRQQQRPKSERHLGGKGASAHTCSSPLRRRGNRGAARAGCAGADHNRACAELKIWARSIRKNAIIINFWRFARISAIRAGARRRRLRRRPTRAPRARKGVQRRSRFEPFFLLPGMF
ncbi:unnamed protein product, partial [Prorocentrum cordatum]